MTPRAHRAFGLAALLAICIAPTNAFIQFMRTCDPDRAGITCGLRLRVDPALTPTPCTDTTTTDTDVDTCAVITWESASESMSPTLVR
jgi:hypothetical protein